MVQLVPKAIQPPSAEPGREIRSAACALINEDDRLFPFCPGGAVIWLWTHIPSLTSHHVKLIVMLLDIYRGEVTVPKPRYLR